VTVELTERVRYQARSLGFTLFGVAAARPTEHMAFYRDWIAGGLHGEMTYLARADALARRADLERTMRGVRSVVVVGHEYGSGGDPAAPSVASDASPGDPSTGIVARYARGADYHRVVKRKLITLLGWIDREVAEGVRGRAYVDTGPILERDLARRAGLGWHGRNTMLIHPRRGSYFFIGTLLLDAPLEVSEPFESDHCGSCRACLDACPTGALLGRDEGGAPVIDARRCISYLTIELRGSIPRDLRPLMGNRVFGCDICQEVCPFNQRFAGEADEPRYAARGPGEPPAGVEALPEERALESGGDVSAETRGHPRIHPGTRAPSLIDLMRMTREEWNAFSRGSPIRRAGYAGFRRNVAVAMGNWLATVDEPPKEAVAVLRDALEDEEPLVQEHARWALEHGCAT